MEFKLPELGEDVEGGDIISITVKVGDNVTKEQTLMEIETDKAVIELPAPVDGAIKDIHVSEGDNVKIGQLLVTFDSDGKQPVDREKDETAVPEDLQNNIEDEQDTEEPVNEITHVEEKTEESGLEDNVISITSEEPVKEQMAEQKNLTQIIPASPSVRRLAREIGVDISQVHGTGPEGRIIETDIKDYAKSSLEGSESQLSPKSYISEIKDNKKHLDPVEKMSKVRVLTAERLTESWKAPHVTQHDKADITELEKIRKQYGEQVKKAGGKLTMTSILTKICTHALKKHPNINCSIDMEKLEIINKREYNIGIAVDTERGLLVPVIKNADIKNITEISIELSDISERSRNKKIKPDELQGSTFTITNLGGIGGTYFTPILNHPNVAILGVSRAVMEPVYIDNEFVPRLMMPLSLSYDHRIVDGADAIRFLRWIIEALENPFFTLLDS